MRSLGELRLMATIDNLRTINHFIQAVAERLNLTESLVFDVELAVEEAATNVVSYAYPPGEAGEMAISISTDGEMLHFKLIDWGLPFEPDKMKPFDITAPIEARSQGGMGLHFIRTLMDSVVYEARPSPDAPNTMIMSKRIQQRHPDARPRGTEQELNALLTVSQLMASNIGLDELLPLIVNKLVEALDADRGTLYLIDEERGELYSRALSADTGDIEEIRMPIGEGIAGYVAETGKVVNIEDAYEDPNFDPSFDQASGYHSRTILAAPMRNPAGEIIGVIQLLNKRSEPAFTPGDERLLVAMAAQAAIGIEVARLHTQEIHQKLTQQQLETARRIQTSFLPDSFPIRPGWDIAACWHPFGQVAGDFYDFYPLPDGRMATLIADVSGKGVSAALFMAMSVTVLRFGMSLNFGPSELLRHANQAIIANQRSRMFTTVFAGYMDFGKGALQFASGGHNPPLLYRRQTGRIEYLVSRGVAVGIFKEAEYAEHSCTLAPGDVLVMYTDGLTETFNAEEEEFGEERLEAIVQQNASLRAQALADLILEHVAEFNGDQGAADDQTLVIIKRQ